MTPDPPAPWPAIRAALTPLRLAAFTGRLVVTVRGGAVTRVHSEGVGDYLTPPPNWAHAHGKALAAVRCFLADVGDGCIVMQWRSGVPCGVHLDSAP